MMWPEFVPIECRGVSIITALILFGVIAYLIKGHKRIDELWEYMATRDDILTDIRVSLGEIKTNNRNHFNQIKEIKDLIEKAEK